jgi:putative ABC transport system permease protein
METVEISTSGMIFGFALLIIPIIISIAADLKLVKDTIWSILRMSVQLFFVGFFLEYIFDKNNIWLNLIWLSLMFLTAVFSAVSRAKLKFNYIFIPSLLSFIIPTFLILMYFNYLVINLTYIFDARYLIALGGMLLGNVLGTNIVAVNSFYQNIKTEYKFFKFRLAQAGTKQEVFKPFIRKAFHLALKPALAKTATMGIVSLPGMMSGQILGGSTPANAIKYQIMIMVAIYVVSTISALISIIFSINLCFTELGTLKENIFKKN